MRKIAVLILMALLFTPQEGIGQSSYSGFMGKRGLLQMSVSPWVPILQTVMDDNYTEKSGTLVKKKCLFMMDTRLSLSFYKKRNVGFGIEIAKGFFSFAPVQYIFVDGYKRSGRAELIRVSTTQIMPKLELSGSQGLLPVGIAHTIGVGLNIYEIKNQDYLYEMDEDLGYSSDYLNDHYYNFANRKFKGFTVLYGITMRLPITERLLFNYSLNYTVNVALSAGETTKSGGLYFVTRDRMLETLQSVHALQFIKMSFGLSLTI